VPTTAVSSRWIGKRKAHWDRLETLVARGRQGLRAFSHPELRELGLLYRQTAADLATVREHAATAHLADYLNDLLGRAHNLLYVAPRGRWTAVLSFFTGTAPEVFRQTWRYTAAATALFAAGIVCGGWLALADPGFERHLLGGAMTDTIARGEMWTHSILSVKPLASSAIMTNNLSVAFSAFATGILGGLGTAYMMLFNGIMIGVIGVACHRAGMSLALWSFVAPHGALELPAIFIAGGAGLVLARGVLIPGDLSRRDSLVQAGATAVRLLLLVVPLLVIAGLIEAFVSPVHVPAALKLTVGGAMLVLLTLYLGRGFRRG
jgi:uncharacterized membrane protein SpoIIM required for sporulation